MIFMTSDVGESIVGESELGFGEGASGELGEDIGESE